VQKLDNDFLGVFIIELDDIREYVFPLFVGDDPDRLSMNQPIHLANENFLGTGFFITKNGVALTAGHCVLPPDNLPGKALLAIVWDGDHPRAQKVTTAFVLENHDIGILKISFSPSKYLPLSFKQVHMGEDVSAVGIPSHSVSGIHKEFRCLKGHVTFAPRLLELSFSAPRGMSGSPVFCGRKVVGVLTWNARSEALEDQTEETTEKIGNLTKVTKVVTKAVVNYGLAEPLYSIKDAKFIIGNGLPFSEFIMELNRP
jgi:hypothetical protein